MLLAEAVGLAAMLVLLRRAALPPARLLLFAWNPLAAWTFAGNGHVDALAVAAVGLALLARGSRREGLTGVLLGVAVLVKFLPAAIAPALWQRWGWRLPLATLATIVALYAIYAGAGRHVLGFLPQYTQEEGLTQGSGFWLVAGLGELVRLPAAADHVYIGVALAALLALALAVAFRARPPREDAIRVARDAGLLAGALILAISPHYPWYFPWLGLFCCLAPMPELIYLSVAPLALYLDPLHERFLWPSVVYVPTLALAAARLAGRRAPV